MVSPARVSLLCCLLVFRGTSAFDPVTATIFGGTAVLTSVAITFYDAIKCRFQECCIPRYIPGNVTGLALSLEKRLYGQHLVIQSVLKSLQSHLRVASPPKALVLSFHGWTGGGKNYVSRMISENLYARGAKSGLIHFFSATIHFPHEKHLETYKDQLREWIRGNVSACARSLFIFDEMEKMPATLLDAIKPYLDHHDEIDSVDYRKSIFIFLSNAGGDAINSIVQQHSERGLAREELRLKDFDDVLAMHSYSEAGGLRGSSLIDRSLVSAFVPFLPLERQHVRLCIRDDLLSKGHAATDFVVDQVLSELSFFPPTTRQYAKKGCKSVSEKVNLVVEELESLRDDMTT